MGRVRLLDVRRHQRRSGGAGRALRLDHQPQLPRPAGTGSANAPDVARDGGRGRGQRASRRRASTARWPEGIAMDKFTKITGPACPINQTNLNTDQILPARYLKWTRAQGIGKVLFNDLRFDADGKEKDFPI